MTLHTVFCVRSVDRRSENTRMGLSPRAHTTSRSADDLESGATRRSRETDALTANMADKTPKGSDAPFATRIDPIKEDISREQLHYIRQVELEQWKKRTSKLRTRNVVTGLAIGAMVLGICILAEYANVNTRLHKANYATLA